MRYGLLVPAAGSGRRFGGDTPKQYLPLAGSTVIEQALGVFREDPRCLRIVVATDPADAHFAHLSLARDPRILRVDGGARRCDSVRRALSALDAQDDEWVLVHDAARPCLSRTDRDALLSTLAGDAVGGLLAAPLADTLKSGDDAQQVTGTPSRAGLWRALTPQMFRAGLLGRALDAALAAGREPTDESQAVEWLGLSPRLVPGSSGNLKVTTSTDLALAAAVLAQGRD